mgnify:CR=1 FL=1
MRRLATLAAVALLATPPLAAGLLPGVFRAHLLRAGRIAERTLHRADLRSAEACALFNSLRGWIPARVCPSDGTVLG